MIDSDLKPWLLEVNLSPSLNCDTPIDMKIKSALLCDLLNLIGIPAVDPVLKRAQFNQKVINMTQQEEANRLRMSKRPVSMETRRFAAIRLAASSTSLNQVQFLAIFSIFWLFLTLVKKGQFQWRLDRRFAAIRLASSSTSLN